MLKVIGILLIAAAILWMEVPPLLEKKYKKELVVFSTLLTIGVGLSIALGLGKTIPNPLDLLTLVFKPIHDVFVR
jgi:hypothetical protein